MAATGRKWNGQGQGYASLPQGDKQGSSHQVRGRAGIPTVAFRPQPDIELGQLFPSSFLALPEFGQDTVCSSAGFFTFGLRSLPSNQGVRIFRHKVKMAIDNRFFQSKGGLLLVCPE